MTNSGQKSVLVWWMGWEFWLSNVRLLKLVSLLSFFCGYFLAISWLFGLHHNGLFTFGLSDWTTRTIGLSQFVLKRLLDYSNWTWTIYRCQGKQLGQKPKTKCFMKLFLEGKKYLLMRSLIMKASLKTLVRLAQFHMSCNITDNAMPFLLVFGLVIIVQSTSPCFKALVKKQPLSVSKKSNSRRDENCTFLCWSEKSNSRRDENCSFLWWLEKRQFSRRRELLSSLFTREKQFSHSL